VSFVTDALKASLVPALKVYLGDPATYTHKPGLTVDAVTALRSDPTPEEAFMGITAAVKISEPDLTLAPVKGDEITIGGVTYTVFDIRRNAIDLTRLTLHKVSS
jgi:hypothetical protein